jgi:hypothetical protein
MKVFVESILPCSADLAWAAVQTSALLMEVAAPVVTFRPVVGETLPERWPAGQSVRCRMYLFGLIPLGTQVVHLERIDPAAREIQSRESTALVARWDHLVRIRPAADGRCRYSDEVEIEAGWRTPLVWLFALAFYRHRQWRWRRVARRLVAQVGARPR